MRKRTLFKFSLITILCIAIILSTLHLTASADDSAPTADLIHMMTDITSDPNGTKIGDVSLDNVSENASLSLSVNISAQNFSDNYNTVKTLEGLGVNSSGSSTPLFFVENKAQAGNMSYSGIREANEIIVEFYTTFPLSVSKVASLAGYDPLATSQYTNLRVLKTGTYANQLIFMHNQTCGYRPVIYNGEMFHLDSHYNDNHHVSYVDFSNSEEVGLKLTVDGSLYTPSINSTYIGDNAFGVPMYKHVYMYDVSTLTDINNVDLDLTSYEDVLAHTYDDSGLSTTPAIYNTIYGLAMVRFNGLKMDKEETTSPSSSSSSSEGSSGSSSEDSSSSSSSSEDSSSSSSSSSESSNSSFTSSSEESSFIPSTSSFSFEQSDSNAFPTYKSEDSPLITGTSSTIAKEEAVDKYVEKSTPEETVKKVDDEKQQENSLLVIDNTSAPSINESDNDNKTIIDNKEESDSPIINNDTDKSEAFIPQLPSSITKKNEPSVEKVVGSSAVVSAALAIYIVFYKKMVASIVTSI